MRELQINRTCFNERVPERNQGSKKLWHMIQLHQNIMPSTTLILVIIASDIHIKVFIREKDDKKQKLTWTQSCSSIIEYRVSSCSRQELVPEKQKLTSQHTGENLLWHKEVILEDEFYICSDQHRNNEENWQYMAVIIIA